MKIKMMAVALLFAAFCLGAFVSFAVSDEKSDEKILEMQRIENKFSEMVKGAAVSEEYIGLALANMSKIIFERGPKDFLSASQFFVYADRNPGKQLIALCFYDADEEQIKILGFDKISTGNPKKKGHFITPVGIFENTLENFNFRALGTRNEDGLKGFGAKGSRIWDFGCRDTVNKKGWKIKIRLAMHSADPDFGEPKLGKIGSKGCVRVSAKMNKFLDRFGILDKEYERRKNIKKVSYLLRSDRETVMFPGKYLIVGDSSADNLK